MTNVFIYEKTLIKKQDLGLYSGDIALIPDPLNGHPKLNWSGAIIDIDQFRIALAFLKWTHDQHHVEGQIRLFYNEFTRTWKAVALPQYIWSAGHTREVEENDPVKSSIIEELLTSGFGQAGTGHHHSGMGAFQSGGDKEDELGQNGFHFTVGHMGATVADFHCRAAFRKINYDPNQEMLDPNQWLPGLHNRTIQEEIAALWLDLTTLPPFPDEWKTYLREKPEPVTPQWHSTTGFGFAHQSRTTNTEPEMFRDGFFCVRFKPSIPAIQYRFVLVPKSIKREEPAAASPPAAQPPATTPLPTQSELNQQRLTELELKKAKDETSYNELVDQVAAMDQSEYDDFCQNLRDAALKRLAEQLPASDLSNPRGRVIDRLEESLAEFRDLTVSDTADARDLRNVFDALQDLSCRIVKDIETVSDIHENYLHPYLTHEALQELLIAWGNTLFEQILAQGTRDEWNAVCGECSKPRAHALDFYDTMLVGLKRGIIHETIDPIYAADGTLSLD